MGLIYQGSLAFINIANGDRTNFAGNLINGVLGAVLGIWVLDVMLWVIMFLGGIIIFLIVILEMIFRIEILGGIKGLILSFLGKILRGDAMGGGDPKLMSMIGVWLGWQYILPVMLLSAGIGSFVGLLGIAIGKLGFSIPIPYGIFIAISAVLCLFFGDIIEPNYIPFIRSVLVLTN